MAAVSWTSPIHCRSVTDWNAERTIAKEGEILREHLGAKYGTTPEGSRRARARLTAMGTELGFDFNYADDMKMYNTFHAHQLLHWASIQGRQHAVKMALFEAFDQRYLVTGARGVEGYTSLLEDLTQAVFDQIPEYIELSK